MRKYLYISLIIISMMFGIMCKNSSEKNNTVSKRQPEKINTLNDSKADKLSKKWVGLPIWYYDPLTYEYYSDVKNSEQAFSYFFIRLSFYQSKNYHYNCGLDYGNLVGSRVFSNASFETGMDLLSFEPPNSFWCYYSHIFSSDDLYRIFNHIELNHEYFFDNDEFDDLDLPYETTGLGIEDHKYYRFSLIIFDSMPSGESTDHGYMIYKSADELVQGTPLYELFENWETYYLPEMMNHEEYCR